MYAVENRVIHTGLHIFHSTLSISYCTLYITLLSNISYISIHWATAQCSRVVLFCSQLFYLALQSVAHCGQFFVVAYFSTALHINYHVCAALHMAVRSTSIGQSSSWAFAVAYCCVKFCTLLQYRLKLPLTLYCVAL